MSQDLYRILDFYHKIKQVNLIKVVYTQLKKALLCNVLNHSVRKPKSLHTTWSTGTWRSTTDCKKNKMSIVNSVSTSHYWQPWPDNLININSVTSSFSISGIHTSRRLFKTLFSPASLTNVHLQPNWVTRQEMTAIWQRLLHHELNDEVFPTAVDPGHSGSQHFPFLTVFNEETWKLLVLEFCESKIFLRNRSIRLS